MLSRTICVVVLLAVGAGLAWLRRSVAVETGALPALQVVAAPSAVERDATGNRDAVLLGDSTNVAPRELGPRGVVLDTLGAPVVGAQVLWNEIGARGPSAASAASTTDAKGAFALAAPRAASVLQVTVEGFVPHREQLGPRTNWGQELRIVLLRRDDAHVALVAPDGRPVANATAVALPTGPDKAEFIWVSDDAGHFDFGALPPGKSWFLVTAKGFPRRMFELRPTERGVTWTLMSSGAAELRVRSALAATVKLAWLCEGARWACFETQLVPDGEAWCGGFADLPPGEYWLRAVAGDGSIVERVCPLPTGSSTDLELDFTGRASVRVRTHEWWSRSPLASIELDVVTAMGPPQRVSTDENGWATLTTQRPNEPISVRIATPGWAFAASQPVTDATIRPGADGESETLLLVEAVSVRGRVVGDRCSSAALRVMLYAGRTRDSHWVGRCNRADGSFEFVLPRRAAGPYMLSAESETCQARLEIDFRGEELEGLELKLEPTAQVFGAVRARGSALPAEVELTLIDEQTGEALGDQGEPTQLGADGEFVFRGVFPGHYRVRIPGHDTQSAPIVLVSGASVGPLTLELRAPDVAAITGVVVDERGVGVSNVMVTCADPTCIAGARVPVATRTDLDGRFTIRPAAPGLQRVCASTSGGFASVGRFSAAEWVEPGAAAVQLTLSAPATCTILGAWTSEAPARWIATNGATHGMRTLQPGPFVIDDAPTGSVQIQIASRGHEPLEFQLEIEAGARVDLGLLTPVRLAPWTLDVRDDTDRPVVGASLYLLASSALVQALPREDALVGLTDARGRLEFEAPLDGSRCAVVWKRGLAPVRLGLEPHGPRALSARLERSGDLRVEGLRPWTRDSAVWTLELRRAGDRELARAHGLNRWLNSMEVLDLEPGRYHARWTPTAPDSQAQAFERDFEISAPFGWTLLLGDERTAPVTPGTNR